MVYELFSKKLHKRKNSSNFIRFASWGLIKFGVISRDCLIALVVFNLSSSSTQVACSVTSLVSLAAEVF